VRKDDKEQGVIKEGIRSLETEMLAQKARTYGELLERIRLNGGSVRLRANSEGSYNRYPSRQVMEAEFNHLWESQVPHHPEVMTEALRERLITAIFYQRPLKPVYPGRCTLEPDEYRMPKAMPMAHEFRIRSEVANLTLKQGDEVRTLTANERQIVVDGLLNSEKLTFTAIAKLLGFRAGVKFNLEGDDGDGGKARNYLIGDLTSSKIRSVWPNFSKMPENMRLSLILALLDIDDELELKCKLRSDFGISPEVVDQLSSLMLPAGYINLSQKAVRAVLPYLQQGMGYAQACAAAGYHHSDHRPEELTPILPFYNELPGMKRYLGQEQKGKPGRISNPTVHVALNQVRKVYNTLVEVFGVPDCVNIEVTRELKQTAKQKIAANKQNAANKKVRDAFKEKFPERANSDQDLVRWRLWNELPEERKVCVYSGKEITLNDLFSPRVEIDHIIPHSISFDNSPSNLVLCAQGANRLKTNKTPHEAFAPGLHKEFNWSAIEQRVFELAADKCGTWAKKKLRFKPDYLDVGGDFATRQLNDTAYLSKVVRIYLGHSCPKVLAVRGAVTAICRKEWGLDRLLRDTVSDHADLFCLSSVKSTGVFMAPHHVTGGSHDIREDCSVNKLLKFGAEVVRVDPIGRFQTPGEIRRIEPRGPKVNFQNLRTTTRKPLTSLTANSISQIKDDGLRTKITAHIKEVNPKLLTDTLNREAKVELSRLLGEFGQKHSVGRVRIVANKSGVIVRHGAANQHTKVLIADTNHHGDVVVRDGKVKMLLTTYAELNHPPEVEAGWTLKMRLHKGDMIRVPGYVYNKYPKKPNYGKDRSDHRHHAVDAFVIACITPSLLRKISRSIALSKYNQLHEFPEPYERFKQELKTHLRKLVVSNKLDHSISAPIFTETNYGFTA